MNGDHSGLVPDAEYLRYAAMDEAGTLDTPLAEFLAHVGVLPGHSVADIGCGPAKYLFPLAEHVGPDGHVYAVDADPHAIAFVARRVLLRAAATGRRYENVTTVLSTFDDTRLPASSIEWAFLQQVHNYTFTPNAAGGEDGRARFERENLGFTRSVHRALRPGGVMVVVEMEQAGARSGDEVVAWVERTGLFRLTRRDEAVWGNSYQLTFQRL